MSVIVAITRKDLRQRLRDRDPICLLTHLDGDRVRDVAMFGPEAIAGAGEDAVRLGGIGHVRVT